MSDTSNDHMPNMAIIAALVKEGCDVAFKKREVEAVYRDRKNHHRANSGLETWTLPICQKLHRMEPEKRRDAIRHLLWSIDACHEKIWSKDEPVGDLVEMAEAAEDADEEQTGDPEDAPEPAPAPAPETPEVQSPETPAPVSLADRREARKAAKAEKEAEKAAAADAGMDSVEAYRQRMKEEQAQKPPGKTTEILGDDEEDLRPRHLVEAEKQREVEAAGDEPAPAAPPRRRRKVDPLEDATGVGNYQAG